MEISYQNPFSRSMERRNSFLRMDQDRRGRDLALLGGKSNRRVENASMSYEYDQKENLTS